MMAQVWTFESIELSSRFSLKFLFYLILLENHFLSNKIAETGLKPVSAAARRQKIIFCKVDLLKKSRHPIFDLMGNHIII